MLDITGMKDDGQRVRSVRGLSRNEYQNDKLLSPHFRQAFSVTYLWWYVTRSGVLVCSLAAPPVSLKRLAGDFPGLSPETPSRPYGGGTWLARIRAVLALGHAEISQSTGQRKTENETVLRPDSEPSGFPFFLISTGPHGAPLLFCSGGFFLFFALSFLLAFPLRVLSEAPPKETTHVQERQSEVSLRPERGNETVPQAAGIGDASARPGLVNYFGWPLRRNVSPTNASATAANRIAVGTAIAFEPGHVCIPG